MSPIQAESLVDNSDYCPSPTDETEATDSNNNNCPEH